MSIRIISYEIKSRLEKPVRISIKVLIPLFSFISAFYLARRNAARLIHRAPQIIFVNFTNLVVRCLTITDLRVSSYYTSSIHLDIAKVNNYTVNNICII